MIQTEKFFDQIRQTDCESYDSGPDGRNTNSICREKIV